ncbi:MAG: hypothetical protein GKR94_28410 [Gammaproteobacteria bacterium]|nr:hypothetical protein [Gammaproteobacteria bacterium]
MTDHDKGIVIQVADERKSDSFDEYFDTLPDDAKKGIECVTMDRSKAYIPITLQDANIGASII